MATVFATAASPTAAEVYSATDVSTVSHVLVVGIPARSK